MTLNRSVSCLTAASLGIWLTTNIVQAQVIPDGSVNTIVTSGPNFTITGGGRSGNNLFHSFSQFSLPTGDSAIFDNALDVQNIFSRVTGGTASNIDGVIQANGTANLFLLNPSGLLFGPNAKLNIGGSFLGTTASSIKFADGAEFSATNSAPLLTMSVPIGLQMGQTPANIQVQGTGHTQIYERGRVVPFDRRNSSGGLMVPSGKTLALLGGSVVLDSGVLTAGDGQIELGAVGGNNFASLSSTPWGWQLGYDGITSFGNIQLNERSLIDASGFSGGSIQLQGRQIDILNASVLLLQNFGSTAAGKIEVNATEILRLQENSAAGRAVSEVSTETFGNGHGGDIIINTAQVKMSDGSQVAARTFGSAAGGAVQVRATDRLEISGSAPGNPVMLTGLGTGTFGNTGVAGDVSVFTKQLEIQDGGALSTFSAAIGNAGTLTINASEFVKLSGVSSFLRAPSGISLSVFGSGNAGWAVVNTDRLSITNGAQISSSTFGSGAAGRITISAANSVVLDGGTTIGALFIPSRITSASEFTTPEVQQAFGLQPFPTGSSGNVEVNTPTLQVRNHAFISVANNSANGNGGSLNINAGVIGLDQNANLSASTVSGEGGNIRIRGDLLSLRHASQITTTAGGTGDGGDLMIDSPIILGLENSDIIANAQQGSGGNIQITTQGILGLKYRDRLTPENDITASSEFGVNGTVQVNTIGVDPNSGLTALPVDIVDPSQKIATGCASNRQGSFVVTGRGGVPTNPHQNLTIERPWLDLRASPGVVSPGVASSGVASARHALPIPPVAVVEAVDWRRNHLGQPELIGLGVPPDRPQITTCAS
jgi:filamentous hemagglutinin family protein